MNKEKEQMDFLAIGDIVIDAFIDLKDVRIDTDPDKGDKGMEEICFRFGDKVEYENLKVVSAVGNSPNAAVCAARLGLKSGLVSDIGDDGYGQDNLKVLEAEGVQTNFISTHAGMQSNYHYVLQFKAERTILVKHYEYPYKLPKIGEPSWIYLSSMANNSMAYHHEIVSYLQAHPSIKLAFQPGTFQIKLGKEKLKELYTHTEIFFCNLEESQSILETDEKDIRKLSEGIQALGPKIVCLSDGPKGAYLYYQKELWHIPMYPDTVPPVDRTGAGDSFSSTITCALALGKSPLEALSWGPINSMSVVQEIGAQKGLLTREKLEEYLKNAPADYKARKI